MANEISWVNKDLISKILSDKFGNKVFSTFGVRNLPKIKEYLPTEFPTIETSESFLDRLFKLSDDSLLIVDFESESAKKNFVKYARYFARVLEKYGPDVEIRILVVYTGDVSKAMNKLVKDCGMIKVRQAYLSHINGDKVFKALQAKIQAGKPLRDEDIVKLIILPLSYRGTEKKIEMIDKVIDEVEKLKDDEVRTFILSGLCVATDKFITEKQSMRIEELIRMTRVGKRIWDDWNRTVGDVRYSDGVESVARNMLNSNYPEEEVIKQTGLSQEKIDEILGRKKETGQQNPEV